MRLRTIPAVTALASTTIAGALCVTTSSAIVIDGSATSIAIDGQTPPQPPAAKPATPADPESQAYDAADALMHKAAYIDAAAAFDEFAKNYPTSARAGDALCEAGSCWFTLGRRRQKLQQNNPESIEAMDKSLAFFERVLEEHPTSASAGHAQFLRGQVKFFSGDLKAAEAEFTLGFEKHADDEKYCTLSLERRACVRRGLLRPKDSVADLELLVKQYPKSEQYDVATRYLTYTRDFGKLAPALDPEAWIQGEPTTIASLHGDLVVVYLFETWCPHCAEARPFLIDLVDRYEPLGVHFIGVVTHSEGQTVEKVRAFLPANKLNFPVIMDRGRTMSNFQGQKIPDMIIIDRAGRVRWHDNPAVLQYATLEALLMDDTGTSGPKAPAPSDPKH